ncbi:hypothetical protein VOLCADRAFT_91298 [Volvox carteri f. nagariensis]|uniref:Uncharacterized protein n=1 Tax=Volvox carteri f. nagariensis TaxID=3068 RepID=D8TWP3_VOLCA|nr:uncharacterized protein VOLCADRAFT_91298 [Volvox carteri f. nagariensis]EFJ48184.1 hypothetical protein VOLCADRAFT_91298 [Volvox carteri f. nagariensis]|eukprot:XP_002950869.1 hypothetical protein VOLCADRAFT_91298 [Volvox carteri f. nagariensis]
MHACMWAKHWHAFGRAPTDSLIVVAGWNHTCVALYGKVKCFGMNNNGQLGLGDNINWGTDPAQMGAALPFVDLGPGLAAVALAAGDAHTCAVLQPGGRVKCWGSNTAGQLGLGDNRTRGLQPTDMGAALPFVDLGPGLYATAIVAGSRHTCVLLQPGGRVKCWGSNRNGRLGLGDTQPRGLQPTDMGAALPFVDLGPGLNATALAAGSAHTCALLQPGSLIKCWGYNRHGQLGLGDRIPRGMVAGQMGARLRPVDFGPVVRTPVAITAGAGHTCAVLQPGGGVRCWGRNSAGQLSLGDTEDRGDQPGETSAYFQDARLGLNESAAAAAAGAFFTCALLVPGSYVKCWGTCSPLFRPISTNVPFSIPPLCYIRGRSNAHGALGQGRGGGWGWSSFGDDNYEPGNQIRPVDLGYGLRVESIAAGGLHVCAILKRSRSSSQRLIKCWG